MSSYLGQSLTRIIRAAKRYLQIIISRLAFLIFLLITFSYHARLQNFSIRPIEAIARQSDNPDQLGAVLANFRRKKQKDLEFVRPASTLSAIAVIGIFSWPDVTDSFWLARVFLYWSLSFSVFSLISSTIDQLLEWVPELDDETSSEEDRVAILPLLVHRKVSNNPGPVLDFMPNTYRPNWLMVYVWQCPAMMMSWSWVLVYAGFILYILTPVIPHEQGPQEIPLVVAVMVLCGLTIVNFFFCTYLANLSLEQLRKNRDLEETAIDDSHDHDSTKNTLGLPSPSSRLFCLTRQVTPEVLRDSFHRFITGGLSKN